MPFAYFSRLEFEWLVEHYKHCHSLMASRGHPLEMHFTKSNLHGLPFPAGLWLSTFSIRFSSHYCLLHSKRNVYAVYNLKIPAMLYKAESLLPHLNHFAEWCLSMLSFGKGTLFKVMHKTVCKTFLINTLQVEIFFNSFTHITKNSEHWS